jgi:hypothetical protein
MLCAVALVACIAPGAHADEYTKQTFLTFSGPVQLPGITLAAGTYQFKLADPEFGRRVLQVWDKDGTKLLTTLLTIPDHRITPTSEPVVMFGERPTGQPQAIRSWFYPNESYGQEFVYPKTQAMKIAKDMHTSVLAYEGDAKDEAAFQSAKVGRIDENGNMSDADKADLTASNSATTSSAPAPSANSTSSSSAITGTSPSQSASTTTADASQAASGTMPSANRSGASAPPAVGTSRSTANPTSEANRDNTNIDQRAVGTSGTTASSAQPRELPSTASSTMLIELLAGLSLAAAFVLRTWRVRANASR